MKELGKIIYALLIISATFIITDRLFGLVADRNIAAKSGGKPSYDLNRIGDEKMIILGSSRAAHHYDTEYLTDSLGIPSYNFGIDGRGITYHEAILSTALKKDSPQLIILDINPEDFKGFWNERISILYPYLPKHNDIKRIATDVDTINRLMLKSNLYRYNSALLSELKWKFQKYKGEKRGYSPLEPKIMNGMAEIDLNISETIDSVTLKSFRNIIKMTEENKIPLIIVISPIYNKIPNIEFLIDIIKRNAPNAYLIDDSDMRFGDNSLYFNDNAHLNKDGALLFTKYLYSQLDSILGKDKLYGKGENIN